MKSKKSKKIDINVVDFNVAYLLETLDNLKIDKKDYSQLKFELDWHGCYYEGDSPEIRLIGEIK